MASPAEQCPRGPWTALHDAASEGSCRRVLDIVTGGSIEINQGSPEGWTPLMLASDHGYSRIVSFLLSKGAIAMAMGDDGVTALHVSAKNGHVDVVVMLVQAGVDAGLSSPSSGGYTPLHLAAQRGRCRVMEVLVRAGAGVNDCLEDGSTAMYLAAERGQLGALKILLDAEADPMIETAGGHSPLDIASEKSHLDIVRELVRRTGIERCGGSDRGMLALRLAAQNGHLEMMGILHKAGVMDSNGLALCAAIMHGGERMVKLLLQWSDEYSCGCSYANNAVGAVGKPLMCCLVASGLSENSGRVMRRLIDAGAVTTFTFNRLDDDGNFMYQTTPLDMVIALIHEKQNVGTRFTQRQMHGLRGIQRLLMQVDAVHAVSWGWVSSTADASTAGSLLVPIRRGRAAIKTRVCRRALFRYARKLDAPFLGYAEDGCEGV